MFEKEERSGWGHPDITQITSMKKSPAIAIWYLKPCCSLFHRLFTVLHTACRMTGVGTESTAIIAQQSFNASCAKYQPISASKSGITPRYSPGAQPLLKKSSTELTP